MEEAAAGAQLLQLHGLGARGQRSGEPQRRTDRHEQHGALAGTSTRFLLVRMTPAPPRRRPRPLTLPLHVKHCLSHDHIEARRHRCSESLRGAGGDKARSRAPHV